MGIGSMYNLGSGALRAHQNRIGTHQNNVANASTPGYRRQRVGLEALGARVPAQGGVRAGRAASIADPLADRVVPRRRGEVGLAGGMARAARLAEVTIEGDGLADGLERFFAAADALEIDGAQPSARRAFVDAASALTSSIRGRHDALTRARGALAEEASGLAGSVQEALTQIASLDDQIASGGARPETVDQRDELVDLVAGATGAEVVVGGDGRVGLITPSGAPLLEAGRARSIELSPGPGGVAMTIGGRPASGLGGELGALVRADAEIFGDQIERLDQFADALATEANALHTSGAGLDGVSGRPLFEQGGAGGAARIEVSGAIADDPSLLAAGAPGTLPGGSGVIASIGALRTGALAGGPSALDRIAEASGALGRSGARYGSELERAEEGLAHAEALRAATSGVSLEEEMVQMTEAMRAFEASTKLIKTADEMMQTVLSLR